MTYLFSTLLALFIWFKVIPYLQLMFLLRKVGQSDDWDKINKECGEWRKD